MSPSLTRRELLAGGAGLAALLGLAACSSGSGSAATVGSGSSGGAVANAVQHKYGTTTLPGGASRVITLGYTDQEPVLALGVRPIGVVDFFEERPYGNWPWTKDIWADTTPEIVGKRDDYNFEKIASLRPDLVIGMYSGMTKGDYTKLSAIAPTVAQPVGYDDFAAPWPVMAKLAGQSLGQAARAEQAVNDVLARFSSARDAHPQWKGRTVAVAEPADAGQWAVFGASDPKLQFMEGLGFTIAPSVRAIEPGGDVGKLSTERLSELDVDQLVLLIDNGDQTEAQIKANPLFNRLTVAQQNRTAFLPFSGPPPIGASLAFNSVLSIPYGLEQVVPSLTA